MIVWLDDIQYCPFCGSDDLDMKNYGRGTVHCIDCGAVFAVDEADESERPAESEEDDEND